MTSIKKLSFFLFFVTIIVPLSFTWFFETGIALGAICPPGAINCETTSGGILNDTGGLENVRNTVINNDGTTYTDIEGDTERDVYQEFGGTCPSGTYCLLAPLPGIETVPRNQGFADYAQIIINLIIGFSALLAVLMFMIGGFTYMTGDSIGSKSEGRGIMTNAIFGFVLLLASYIILQTINPELLKLDLNVQQVIVPADDGGETGDGGGSGGTQTASQAANNALAKQMFGEAFSVNKGGCINEAQTNCTSLDVRDGTRNGIINLQNRCSSGNVSCDLIISGGAEGGHESGTYSHKNGYKMDISYRSPGAQKFREFLGNQSVTNEDTFIQETGSSMKPNTNYIFQNNGYAYIVRLEEGNGQDHWDIAVVSTPR